MLVQADGELLDIGVFSLRLGVNQIVTNTKCSEREFVK